MLWTTVLLALTGAARATGYGGGDLGGADLTVTTGDTLSGVFTNVGTVHINGLVSVGTLGVLEIHARTAITVDGVLDASGLGGAAGLGGVTSAEVGTPGLPAPAGGTGGDTYVSVGFCYANGGGGGGNGGNGGYGGYITGAFPGGGAAVGNTNTTDYRIGGGGGGGGAQCDLPYDGADGARGGGGVFLDAPSITINGSILVDGADGASVIDIGTATAAAGGGGAGGTIVIQALDIAGTGLLSALGGTGGDADQDSGAAGAGGGGGGGGGGRIKLFYASSVTAPPHQVLGGDNGKSTPFYSPGADGTNGTFTQSLFDPDPDADGANVYADNCLDVANPSQADQDGDGLGDACDACPLPSDPFDSDGDLVCDHVDQCPGYDDNLDADKDGFADDCDVCPAVADPGQADTDGDLIGDACDACPLPSDPFDNDADTVCDNEDVCPRFDDLADADEDGIPDGCDVCPHAADPDQLDQDGDGFGDACDVCPLATDPEDSDGDLVCDGVDACPGFDDRDDIDGDGEPDACDPCPVDAGDDSDFDGVCDGVDVCPGASDYGMDTDGDGLPDACDNCVDDPNTAQWDVDSDGYGDECDCGPGSALIHPGADEVCDGKDNDCDGTIDQNATDGGTYFQDADGDGHGNPNLPITACVIGAGMVVSADDCDDGNASSYPGAEEICGDSLDNDCDGEVDQASVCGGTSGPPAKTGCGCAQSAPGGWLAGLLVASVALRRRRRG